MKRLYKKITFGNNYLCYFQWLEFLFKIPYHKLITWPLILVFLCQNMGWSVPSFQPSAGRGASNYQPIYIPEQYGRIEKYNGIGVNGQIVLIKDAHCNYEAQTNIAKILDILIRDYKIDLIGEEGSSGHINPSIALESNPKEETRKKVSDKFLKTGLLIASESLSINKGKDPGFKIWGVEDLRLYLKDYKAFRDTLSTNSNGKHFIELLLKIIGQLKKNIYSAELQKFDNLTKKYKSNELPLSAFIQYLHLGHGILKQHKNLKLILKSIRLEKDIDFNKVEQERTGLIKKLEKTLPKEDLQELVKKSLLFKLGKIPSAEYYTYLSSFWQEFPAGTLKKYTRLVKLQDEINESLLFRELEDLTENIYIQLCVNKATFNLHELDRDITILNKIFTLEATRDDLSYYKENNTRFTPENLLQFVKIQAPLNNISLSPELNDPSFIENTRNAITPAEEFYKLALERDKALVENLLEVMDKNKKDKAVLVCGGFHAEGIKKILDSKGISTITITPSITKIQEDCHEIYLNRMMDSRINPEKMLAELGLETLRPEIATGPQGIQIGLAQPLIDALREQRIEVGERLTPEEFLRIIPLLQELYQQNDTLASFIEKAVEDYNTSLPEGAERIALEKLTPAIATPPAHIAYMGIPMDTGYYSSELERNGKSTVSEIERDMQGKTTSIPIEGKTAQVDNNLLQELGITDKEFLAVLSKALAEAGRYPGADLSRLSDNTLITLLDKSSHLAENHINDGFVGINRQATEIYKQIYMQFGKEMADNFIQLLLEHELVHELTGKGEEIELDLMNRDARRFVELAKASRTDPFQMLLLLQKNKVNIDENFSNQVQTLSGEIPVTSTGLCVTGDTLLPIISAGEFPISNLQSPNKSHDPLARVPRNSKFQNVEFREIIDVKPGDYVLSLNEKTQQIEPHRINGLLDMGIKPVYRLTTASGRTIKTTANHPYLTRNGWVKVSKLKEGDEIGVPSPALLATTKRAGPGGHALLFTENRFRQTRLFNHLTKNPAAIFRIFYINSNLITQFFPILMRNSLILVIKAILFKDVDEIALRYYKFRHALWMALREVVLQIYPSDVLDSKLSGKLEEKSIHDNNQDVYKGVRAGEIARVDLQDLMTQYSQRYLLQERLLLLLGFLLYRKDLTQGTLLYNDPSQGEYSIAKPKGTFALISSILKDNYIRTHSTLHLRSCYNLLVRGMSRFFWAEVEAAEMDGTGRSTNAQINTDILWDKITSIDYLGYLHVYDIEVEGTHNFIGNGIFAHNTAMGDRKPHTLKAPGSEPLDEDGPFDSAQGINEKAYVEEVIGNSVVVTDKAAVGKAIGLIPGKKPSPDNVVLYIVDLVSQLGIPRSRGTMSAKELIYAYGRKEADDKLHIYVTRAFWERFLKQDLVMLAFLIDHEYQENILGKTHAETSKRAWLFTDETNEDKINPFYRFYIDQLARESDIETLQKLTMEHPNDTEGRFRRYVQIAIFGKNNIREIEQFNEEISSHFKGQNPRVLNVTHSTDLSAGLTNVLQNFVDFGKAMGMNIEEFVPELKDSDRQRFLDVGARIRHAIQGDRTVEITDSEWDFFNSVSGLAFTALREKLKDVDIIQLHNHYYLGLVPLIKEANPNIKIIWQCHLEAGDPNPKIWDRLKGYIDQADLVILQPRSNFRDVYLRLDIKPPSISAPPAVINPVSEKYKYLDPSEVEKVLQGYNIDTNRPYFLYTGRYNPEKNLEGVVNAFITARKKLGDVKKPQLVIAVGAPSPDEREAEVLTRIRAIVAGYPELAGDIFILQLSEDERNYKTNALQQGAMCGIYLPHKEGFGLSVTEAMWKGKPVIGMNTGGIATQIQDAQTGYLVDSVNEAADSIIHLALNPQLAVDMGKRAREYVYKNYLVTQLIRNYELAFMSTLDIPTANWLKKNRAVSVDKLHEKMWEDMILRTAYALQKDLLDALEKGDTQKALRVLERLTVIHNLIGNNLTEGGKSSVLVFEKLEDILFTKLRQNKSDETIDLACITLPIGVINKLSYEKANAFKNIFYQRIEDYIRLKRTGVHAAYEQLQGKYYGFAKTRLYVLGLDKEDLLKIEREIFPEALREAGIYDVENYHMYAGHMSVSLKNQKDILDAFRSEEKTRVLYRTAKLIEKFITDCSKEITGRAEVSEKTLNTPVFGEGDMERLDDPDVRAKAIAGILQGRGKYIPENEYSGKGHIPRLSHMINNLARLGQKLYLNIKNNVPFYDRDLRGYLYILNKYLLASLSDNRYKRAFKKESFDTVLSTRERYFSAYRDFMSRLGIPGLYFTIAEWTVPLKITKMGDEIWLYTEMQDGTIMQCFIELDKFNAFNEHYPPDEKDSFYHAILDIFFNLHEEINGGNKFTIDDLRRFSEKINDSLQEMWIDIPDSEPYNRHDGFMPVTYLAKIEHDGKEIELTESRNLLEENIRAGERHILRNLRFHSSEKVKINGEIERLKLYEAKNTAIAAGQVQRFVIYNRRIFTADGKGEDNENDITDKITAELGNYEFNPVIAAISATFTSDLHNLIDMDSSRIGDLNTYQKKHMDKKSADISEIIANQVISILGKYGITGIDEEKLTDTIINAKNGRINIDFMQLWGLINGRITPEKFFEIAASISKPLNTLLGPEAKIKGAQMLNAVLKEILDNLPEAERKEILAREKLTDEERLLSAIMELAEEKGIDQNAIQSIFDLFRGGMDLLTMDPELDMNEIDGAYFSLIRQLEILTGISQGAILNSFKRSFGIDVKITQGKEIKNSVLEREAKRLNEYNRKHSGENIALSNIDNNLWDILFTERAVLKTPEETKTKNQFLSALDAVKKDIDKLVNLLLKGPVKLDEPIGVVIPIEMLIELDPFGTFSYKPGIESIIKNLYLTNIIIAVTVKEDEKKYNDIISVLDKRIKVIRGDVTKSIWAELNIKPDRIAYLFKDKTLIPKDIKAILVEKETPLYTAILLGAVYARTDNVKELGFYLKAIGNMKEDEVRAVLDELNRNGYLTLKLIRIAETLQEFRNRKLFIEVAA